MAGPGRPAMTHVALHVRDVDASERFYAEYCALRRVHERHDSKGRRIVWMAEHGRERELIFVLLPGGLGARRDDRDFGHLGFALPSRAAVEEIARRARTQGCLLWDLREEPYPVGYYCGVLDPDGNPVEFSHGQPLGPGAEDADTASVR